MQSWTVSMKVNNSESIKVPVSAYVFWSACALITAIWINKYVGVAIFAIGVMYIVTYRSRKQDRVRRQAESARLAAQRIAELERLKTGTLDPIQQSTWVQDILKDDEECYWEEPAVEWGLRDYVDLGSAAGAFTTIRVVP